MILPIDYEKIQQAYEEHASNRVGLGESAGLLPNIITLSCTDIDKAIQTAEDLSKVWKPNPELSALFTKWMEQAKKKQADCNKTDITPIPKKKISKNFTPVVIIAAAIVAGIIASKIFTNDKQS